MLKLKAIIWLVLYRSQVVGFDHVQKSDKPFSSERPGSKEWTASLKYPSWGVFLVVLVVLVSTLPIPFYMIKNWPKNWRAGFHRMLCSGMNNYLPDPESDDSEGNMPPKH